MTIISLVAAVDQQYGLGKNNQLLCHLPADLQHFKALTIDHSVIMGRKTFASIGKPLPYRRNIVLSRNNQRILGVEIKSSLEAALDATSTENEVMIIGGADVYQQALPLASRIYLTIIEHTFDADRFFPTIDKTHWQCIEEIARVADEKNPYSIRFCCFEYQ